MVKPRLTLSTASLYRLPLREAFRHAAEAGFDGVEVMVTREPATQDGRRIRALANEFGLSVTSLHAPMLLITRRVWTPDPIKKLERAVEEAEIGEIPLVVAHPPYHWQVRYRRWLDAEDRADRGVTVAVENMFPLKIRGDRGLRFHASQAFEGLDRYSHLVLDTSHLAVARFDPLAAYARYRSKVVHFHLSNNAGKGWDSHLPLDEGVMPIGKLLERLGADGYAGGLALEIDLRRFIEDERSLHSVLVRNREFCARRLEVAA